MPGELYALLARLLSFEPADRLAPAISLAEPGKELLAAGVERELRGVLSESSREQDLARRRLETMAIQLAELHERLAPLGRLVNRAVEIEATLRRLEEPGEPGLTSEQVDDLQERLRELVSDVEAVEDVKAERPAAAAPVVDAWPSTPSSIPPEALPVQSLKGYVLPTLVAAIAGFALGFGVSHAGNDSHAAAAPSASASVSSSATARPAPSGDTAFRSGLTSASSAPSAAASAASSARAEPSAAPSAGPTALPSATAPVVAPPAPTVRSGGRQPDPYNEKEPKAEPETAEDPY